MDMEFVGGNGWADDGWDIVPNSVYLVYYYEDYRKKSLQVAPSCFCFLNVKTHIRFCQI